MRKNTTLLLLLVCLQLKLCGQTAYNVFTQNIHFNPEPNISGFLCGSEPSVNFTMGLTTQDDADLWQTHPLQIKVCISGFEFNAPIQNLVTGSYSANFNWQIDPNNNHCIIGTQKQTLWGTGTDPMFPNPNSSGQITLPLKVPNSLPNGTSLTVDVVTLIPTYMSYYNNLFDDNESTQTQSNCNTSSGCNQAPVLTTSNHSQICSGQNISLTATGEPGAAFQWDLPAGCNPVFDNSISGISKATIANIDNFCSGLFTVGQTKPGCSSPSLKDSISLNIVPSPTINNVTTTCVGQIGQVFVNASGIGSANFLYSINGGPFQNSPYLNTNITSSFHIAVKAPNSECIQFYQGGCLECLSGNTCTAYPTDSISAPKVACVTSPINLTGFFNNASEAYWTSSGTGVFSNSQCFTSPCTVTYTPSLSDKLKGYITFQLETNDPDGNGVCMPARCIKQVILVNELVAPSVSSNLPICNTDTLKLKANGYLGNIEWQTPMGTTFSGPHLVIPNIQSNMSGIYTAKLMAAGCNNSASATNIQVLNLPNLNINTTAYPEYCAGNGNGSMNVHVNGGSGQYQICYNGNLNNCIQNDSAHFNYLPPDTYTVSVTDLSCPNHVFQNQVNIGSGTVVAPPIVTSTISICENETLTLQANVAAGHQVVWTKQGSAFYHIGNNINIPQAKLIHQGLYLAKSINPSGCASVNVPVAVSIHQTPLIVEVITECINNAAKVSVDAINGDLEYSLDGMIYQDSALFHQVTPGLHVLYVKNKIGHCITTSNVEVPNCACNQNPSLQIDAPEIACGSIPIPLTITSSLPGLITAESSGSGQFSLTQGNGNFNTQYTPSIADLITGMVLLSFTTADPDGNGPCTGLTKYQTIFLRNNLSIPDISGNANLCNGDTLELDIINDVMPAQWYHNGNLIQKSRSLEIPEVMHSQSGYYLAKFSGYNCNTAMDSLLVTIQNAPTLTVTSETFPEACEGQGNGQVILNISGGSNQYHVENIQQFSSYNGNSPATYKWLSSGNYDFLIADQSCPNSKISHQVILNSGVHVTPPVSAGYNAPLCSGQALVLTATGLEGNYMWTETKTGVQHSGKEWLINSPIDGLYKVQRIESGCASASLEVPVHVFGEIEIKQIDTFCNSGISDGRFEVVAQINGNDSLEYALNDGGYQDSPVFEHLGNGGYQIKVRAKGSNCTQQSALVDLYCHCYCNKEADISIYPIPNQGQFTVNMALFEKSDLSTIKVFDAIGRKLLENTFTPEGQTIKYPVDLKGLSRGQYTVHVQVDENSFQIPFQITE